MRFDLRTRNEIRLADPQYMNFECDHTTAGTVRACVKRTNGSNGVIAAADMIFSSDLDPTTNAPNSLCTGARQTAMHEGGHALGINGHSLIVPSVMTAHYNDHSTLCNPSLYDAGAFIGLYQSRIE